LAKCFDVIGMGIICVCGSCNLVKRYDSCIREFQSGS
jgi:hypothetical protein